jgi:hypothetical protein
MVRRVAVLIALASAALLAGCGASDSSDAPGEAAGQGTPNQSKPTSEFIIPGGDNTIQLFGREGTEAEREEASEVVVAWDRARATRDWRTDCHHLSRSYTRTVVLDAKATSKGKATNCVQALEFFGAVASGSTKVTTTGPIDSLRVAQGVGYAQYHGRNGIDWIVPLKRQDGEWKVEVTAPVDRRK